MQAFASHFPIACLGFKSSPGAGCAWGVGPVARQQDSDMHFVGFALKPLEKALGTIPLALPVAAPLRITVQHP